MSQAATPVNQLRQNGNGTGANASCAVVVFREAAFATAADVFSYSSRRPRASSATLISSANMPACSGQGGLFSSTY